MSRRAKYETAVPCDRCAVGIRVRNARLKVAGKVVTLESFQLMGPKLRTRETFRAAILYACECFDL